jgi:hypothetical protein
LPDESFKHPRTVLTVADHTRDFARMKYVYPVISRRAKGVSIGINLSPNNACNWRCVYCQVPNLARGASPPVDFPLFESELDQLTAAICSGSYLVDHAPPEARTLKDFAVSGNGEPTSCPDFSSVVRHVGEVRARYGLADRVGMVLITNGSLVQRPQVQEGLQRLAAFGGEVWFKLDRGSEPELAAANGTPLSLDNHLARLCQTASICRTRIQSCWFTTAGNHPSPSELDGFVATLRKALSLGAKIASIQLYTLARKPLLPEGANLGPVSASWLTELGTRLTELGLTVDIGD